MKLARLDTQRIVNPGDIGYPKDSFVAGPEVEIEWDEAKEVVYLRKVKEKAKTLKAIIPLDNVAFMWPLAE